MAKSHGCIPEFFPSFRKASPFPSFLCGLQKINAKRSAEEESMMEQLGYGDSGTEDSSESKGTILPLGPFPTPGI